MTDQAKRGKELGASPVRLFYAALRRMRAKGIHRLSARMLADEMWPNARTHNANGQMFNLASGVAGQMLRRHRGCWEVSNRQWEIVPEFIEPNTEVADPKDSAH